MATSWATMVPLQVILPVHLLYIQVAYLTEAFQCGVDDNIINAPGTIFYNSSDSKLAVQTLTDITCSWTIAPPYNKYVSVDITNIDGFICENDTKIYISTFLSDTHSPGWNICKSQQTLAYDFQLASAKGKWIKIQTQYRQNIAQTFNISYDFKEPGCRGVEYLNGTPSWFTSHPGPGAWAVEAGLKCAWLITAPPDQYITLHDELLSIHCYSSWQTLEIYDSNTDEASTLIARISCADSLPPIASSGRHLFIRYEDRWASNSLGFNISYKFHQTRQSGCGGPYHLSNITGTILSHSVFNHRSAYNPWSRCQWRITAHQGVRITLRFDFFDVRAVYAAGTCSGDMVLVHDGPSNRTGLGRAYCNGVLAPPHSLTSTSNEVNLRFFSGKRMKYQGSGFQITYFATCSPIPYIPNTNVNPSDINNDGVDTVTYSETLSYSCQEGYERLGGDTERVCLIDGTFSGRDLLCLPIRCSNLPRIPHANTTYTDINLDGDTVVTFQEVVTFECMMGYEIVEGDTHRRCMETGELSGRDIVCKARSCGSIPSIPHTVIHSDVDISVALTYLQEAVYHCDEGYIRHGGASMRVCQADGTLSGQNLDCRPKMCADIPSVRNGVVTFVDQNFDGSTRISFGEHVTFTCDVGFVETSGGDNKRFCQSDGRFSGTNIQCLPIRCPSPPSIPQAEAVFSDGNNDGEYLVTYRDYVEYRCSKGFHQTGGDHHRVCLENGNFNGTDLICSPVPCPRAPEIANAVAHITDTNNDGLDNVSYKERVGYTCEDGFIQIGGSTSRRCMEDGKFDGVDIKCQAVDCGTPLNISNADVTYMSTSYGSLAAYTCHEGYITDQGAMFTVTCSNQGIWTGLLKACKAIMCESPLMDSTVVCQTPNSTSPYPFGTKINCTCAEGHYNDDIDAVICGSNGSWTGQDTVCHSAKETSYSTTNTPHWVLPLIIVSACVLAVSLVIVGIVIIRHDRKKKQKKKSRFRSWDEAIMGSDGHLTSLPRFGNGKVPVVYSTHSFRGSHLDESKEMTENSTLDWRDWFSRETPSVDTGAMRPEEEITIY